MGLRLTCAIDLEMPFMPTKNVEVERVYQAADSEYGI